MSETAQLADQNEPLEAVKGIPVSVSGPVQRSETYVPAASIVCARPMKNDAAIA